MFSTPLNFVLVNTFETPGVNFANPPRALSRAVGLVHHYRRMLPIDVKKKLGLSSALAFTQNCHLMGVQPGY